MYCLNLQIIIPGLLLIITINNFYHTQDYRWFFQHDYFCYLIIPLSYHLNLELSINITVLLPLITMNNFLLIQDYRWFFQYSGGLLNYFILFYLYFIY